MGRTNDWIEGLRAVLSRRLQGVNNLIVYELIVDE